MHVLQRIVITLTRLMWLLGLAALSVSGEVKLIVPAGYLPKVPLLALVEVRDSLGQRDWNLWDAVAILSADQPGITLSTNRVALRNGLGSVLLTISGGGDFTLRASVNQEQAARTIVHQSGQPVTSVSGTLPGASTTWRGMVRVTGQVIVPAGHTLTVDPQTLVMIDGVSSGLGIGITVNGTIRSLGTELFPVTITCADASMNWGQIRHDDAQPSVYEHTFISKAGRAPGEGHTGTAPAIRSSNSAIVFDHCVISDLTAGGATVGKIMMATGSDLTIRNSVFSRARMGPEIASTGLLCTSSYFLEMTGPDDADGIYLHNSGTRNLTLSGCVLAGGTDDAVDTLDSIVTIENCVIRDWPNPNEDAKGVSGFNGEVILRHCLIVNCFVGVSTKSSGALALLRLDHCTVTAIDKGVSAATKSNASAGNIGVYVTNSIVRAPDAIHSDFGPEKFVTVTYCLLSEPWAGIGNVISDPLFVDAAGGDFHLLPASPGIDAGDPAFAPDPNGSRTDIGFYTGLTQAGSFFVNITSPVTGAIFKAVTNLTINAATSPGTILKVEFFETGTKLGEDTVPPYDLVWSNVGIGNYSLRAIATQAGGIMTTSSPVNVSVISSAEPATNRLITAGSVWRYRDDGSDQGSTWILPAFNDASWKTNRAEFGYGDGDEATVIQFGPNPNSKYPTSYFRKTFLFDEELGRVQGLNLSLLRDDGAIVYLNGREVFRNSMPPGAANYQTFATTAGEYGWEFASLDTDVLASGTNLVAVEVHQGNGGSSDVSFDLELTAMLAAPTNARPMISLSAPTNGTMIATPASVVIVANAVDPDGTVTNVAFYADETRLGNDSASPFIFAWDNVPAGEYVLTAVATDGYGLSAVSGGVSIVVTTNSGPPRIAAQIPPPGTVSNLVEITVSFTKPVLGVDATDLLINGLAAVGVHGSNEVYTFTVPHLPAGLAMVHWSPSHGITDTFQPGTSFDPTGAGATWQYRLIDTAAPVIARLDPPMDSTVGVLTHITMTFNEPVNGLNASDLLMNSTPATGLVGSGPGPYVFSFAQPPNGPLSVNWSSVHTVRDEAGNAFSASSWSYVLDLNASGILINEIMYHPASENPLEEYIELYNRTARAIDLSGWRLRDGVEFVFPNLSIPAQGHLVVAADLDTFKRKYPNVSPVVGNWTGTLSNSRETIGLDDQHGGRMDSVRYADEGDWAMRQRGSLDRGHRGWVWFAEHDGLGRSLELIHPQLSNDTGQNWTSSTTEEGTPGMANSARSDQIAPFIEDVAHFPMVPRSSEAVLVSAKVTGGTGVGRTIELNFRLDNSIPASFSTILMRDDGTGGDASAHDRIYSITLPPQSNNSVVEFFIRAADSAGNVRTWPGPALLSEDGAGPTGQVVNALYQVDDSEDSGTQPLYKIIMSELERAELQSIHDNINGGANSDAQMNATFVSLDGTGSDLRYSTGVRNRGHGTRVARPGNFRVNFRSDAEWKDVLALNLNAQLSWLQVLGAAINLKAGVAGAYSRAVQLRVNNLNLVFLGGLERTYGSYAANEVIDADWSDHHFPEDGEGNVYRAIRDLTPPDFDYRTIDAYPALFGAEDKNSYTNTWFKTTNVSEDDWTDLIGMLRVLGPNGTEAFTSENAHRVIHVEQWLRHLAVMNLLGNSETGLNSGYNDDYFMYRGMKDPRFVLMYYDLDQIIGFNRSFGPNSTLLSATNNLGAGRALERLLRHPEFEAIYYQILSELVETAFSVETFNALVDQLLGDFVPEAARDQLKAWMETRRSFVRSQLPTIAPASSPRAILTAAPRSPTPRPTATFQVSGEGITHYRYSVNGGALSPDSPVTNPIVLVALPDGTHTLAVIGKNASGAYQSTVTATKASWVVNSAWPAVRLNEIIASRGGNLPDQIELYNEGPLPIDLSGMRLTDDPDDPSSFVFGSTSLPAGGYLTLDSAQLGFSLSASGEGVFLFHSLSAGGALLDSVEFGPQIVDLSIGRMGENGDWQLTQPTLGLANIAQPVGEAAAVRINEWLTSGLSPFPDDFIELYNSEALPVSIGRSYLTDRPAGFPSKSQIRPLTFIPPGGFIRFKTGNGNTPDEINFGLASEQGEIALFAADGSLLDSVVYGPQRIGISSGRCPDGSPRLKALETPTPGGPNHCPFVPPPPQSIALIPFTNVWKYNASGTDLGSVWKETNYDDSAWLAGPGLIGFEDSSLGESLLTAFPNPGHTTYYFRTPFAVDPALVLSGIQITHLIDDGAAFYLNGQEISSRFNLPPAADFQRLASASVANATYQSFTLPPNVLRPGVNWFAVEVHQVSAESSDMVFGLKLEALVVTNSAAGAGVLINEVLANNATLAEADGTHPDWIELYNPASATVDVAGMSLSDESTNPTRWVFPVGSLLPAKAFLRVAFDPDQPRSNSNTAFGLKANGGAVFLFNRPDEGGTLQSSISYGIQASDWSLGRFPDGSTNWVLALPTPAAANISASLGDRQLLKINEWMANPLSGQDWFEIYNPNPEPVALGGLRLSDSLSDPLKHVLPPLSFLGSGGYAFQKFEADESLEAGADHVGFKLSASGESLAVSTPTGVLIDGISFGPQSAGVSQGRLLDGGTNIVAFTGSPSPGASNYLPLQEIQVNELLSHSETPLLDAVEFYNPTLDAVNIGGWFLSDSSLNLRKYQLPPGTVVPARGYLVLYENQFNSDAASDPFSFDSASGEDVYLSQATIQGFLTGYRTSASFGAAENGVSFGRFQTSQGFHFVPMQSRTFGKDNPATTTEFSMGTGAPNSTPRMAPVVLSEIMYRSDGTNGALEFVELYNRSSTTQPLFDPSNASNTWKVRKGIEFDFPQGVTVPPGAYVVLVNFNPVTDPAARATFEKAYGSSSLLYGPYRGRLDDAGDALELQKPDAPRAVQGSNLASVPYIVAERIEYQGSSPWPDTLKGTRQSLQRLNVSAYGNDPINWMAAIPNPGLSGPRPADDDRDGLPNEWETTNGLNPNDPTDAMADEDGDGFANLHEYLAGTNPRNEMDHLSLLADRSAAGVLIRFQAIPGRSYMLEYNDDLREGPWHVLATVPSTGVASIAQVVDPTSDAQRFYRLSVLSN